MHEGTLQMAILLVDDETRLRQALARSLAARGHRVDEAATCREAIDAVARSRYDLLLLDVNLPDATGWDVLRDLRATGRSIPAVVLSAVPPSTSRVREFRPLGVLHKPFPIEALLRLVRQAEGGPESPSI
ncbi:MAG: two-component system, OmpR family, operon response regulator KdpE [Thermomicrobiales bacterium]|nr:two-component system, OmpR family, operon response regulator KdpE [Thermomicrobiales bacterium]MEA2528296.1 two-component system, OmpR family, operon response regulator KdpE [Thermomicrobiales bacterium]